MKLNEISVQYLVWNIKKIPCGGKYFNVAFDCWGCWGWLLVIVEEGSCVELALLKSYYQRVGIKTYIEHH